MPSLQKVYKILYESFGPQYWWPAETRLEVIIGAILVQNTSWKNVEKALGNLKRENLFDVHSIANAKRKKLERAVYPSGFFRQKAERLKLFCTHIERNYDGDMGQFLSLPQAILEKELLSLKGIGRETADSIMLYAAGHPVFIVDAYTQRICLRLGIYGGKNINELQHIFEERLGEEVELCKEFHALLVMLAKNFCTKRPLCDRCPLRRVCRTRLD